MKQLLPPSGIAIVLGSITTLNADTGIPTQVDPASKKNAYSTVTVKRTELTGIGHEKKVMRRDPSDIIKVGDTYYVWYSKGPISPGYDATVWYATSHDGTTWTEKGEALAKGAENTWDHASVFTPNILVAEERYWLFYTGTSQGYYKKPFNPDSKIGIAVADSPDGPWKRLENNPALTNSEDPKEFDSMLIDDACLMVRNGKYWFYYKGRQQGKEASKTQMGVAIAEKPEGPYIKYEGNPVIPGNHAVLAWPEGEGVSAIIGKTGPKDLIHTVQYSEDGLNFTKKYDIVDGPRAGATYHPEAFTDSKKGKSPEWGIEIGQKKGSLPYLQRVNFDFTGKPSEQ